MQPAQGQEQMAPESIMDRTPRELQRMLRSRLSGREPLAGFGPAHPCVFVLSTGRAGTKTLAELLALAGNLDSHHEPKPKLFGLSRLSYELGGEPAALRVFAEAFVAARRSLLDCALRCRKGYAETSPQVTFLAPAISATLPSSVFVHLVRSPTAVVRSAMRRGWYEGHSFDDVRITPDPSTDVGRRWKEMGAFSKNVWLWNETNRWIADYLDDLPDERKLLLRAEDVFDGDEAALGQMFAFVRSGAPSARRVDRVLARRLNAQRIGEFPEARDWSTEMNEELLAVAGETARALGYTST